MMFEVSSDDESIEKFPKIVKLNVGGTLLTTTSDILKKCSRLECMLDAPYLPGSRDKDGNIFIDRNGKWFEYILDFLRDDKQIPPRLVYRQVLREALFYGIASNMQAAARRANEVKNAEKIRAILGKEYAIIKSDIIEKGPKFILIMTNINFDQYPNQTSDGSNVLGYGTGERCIDIQLSSENARSIVSCLWNDLRSEGYNLDVDIYCLKSGSPNQLVAVFRLLND